ncbi:MAG: DegT/DnrJ/EryC1/StrS family aminotransferase [Kiritimatiellae bacterium]|nr:DegT/DnrJ/EryC1/StrS family aminotransferase [Kiritimatiellia bacterium]
MYRAGQEEIDEIAKVIRSKQWFRVGDEKSGHLKEIDRFEQEWAKLIGVKYALLMSGGGTAGLVCALAALGIGPGDEVIVPAYTWLATATAALTVGAIPLLAEVDETLGLDPADLERRIGPHTKAVIPVHMSGRPANLEGILAVARRHGLKVVEDSCQMDGGSYKGRRTGAWGDIGVFSFNYFKIISTGGEGGCVVTNDRSLYERAFVYHDSGAAFRPQAGDLSIPIFVAQQYRADEVMGAIARVQLQRLEGILADLRRVRQTLADAIADQPGVRVAPSNDQAGDCGVMLTLQFQDESKARAFASAAGGGSFVLIDHGKHVYTNWTPLREKRVAHRADMNPFNFQQNRDLRADYSDTACPRTLEILRHTVHVPMDPDWTADQLRARAKTLKAALS